MKKNAPFLILYVIALVITAVNTFFSMKNYIFSDINALPQGEFVSEEVSPSGNKSVKIYLVENSLGTAIRGELKTGPTSCKNIFWQTGIKDVTVHWQDDDLVYFNNVPISGNGNMPYDCRRGTALFTDGALEDERLDPANE